jgi:hypothetical protein
MGSGMEVLEHIASGDFGRVERVRVDGGEFARKLFSPLPEILKAVGREKLLRRFVREDPLGKLRSGGPERGQGTVIAEQRRVSVGPGGVRR